MTGHAAQLIYSFPLIRMKTQSLCLLKTPQNDHGMSLLLLQIDGVVAMWPRGSITTVLPFFSRLMTGFAFREKRSLSYTESSKMATKPKADISRWTGANALRAVMTWSMKKKVELLCGLWGGEEKGSEGWRNHVLELKSYILTPNHTVMRCFYAKDGETGKWWRHNGRCCDWNIIWT